MTNTTRRGRFAPSPTGQLHMGSMVAAVGSYLNIRSQHGEWLLRMDDIDPPREEPGAAASILESLEAHGLYWEGEVMYQSHRNEAYEAALEQLHKQGLSYYCRCTRKQIEQAGNAGDYGPIYSGHCRDKSVGSDDAAIRICTSSNTVITPDLIQGDYQQILDQAIGDFVVRRRDKLYAYHLAVVVDDAEQDITEIVRGLDLLDSTPRQQYLQQCLGLPTPVYAHLPIVLNQQGQKLSKQNLAPPLDSTRASDNLYQALVFLKQNPPTNLAMESPDAILEWGVKNWDMNRISKTTSPD
ncbi:MAG: tRNA glutamyl-Q(34) synthetase GluQRS [Proteobacteria bacterium]|nr:tRNA glutamyl-Q(34) synthetase GluQRS [Pseudomonadota bacterium]